MPDDQTQGNSTTSTPPNTQAAPPAIDKDYVNDLDKQRISWKTRASEFEAELKTIREENAKLKTDLAGRDELHKAEVEKVRGEFRQSDIRRELLVKAKEKGLIDPDLVSLFDTSKISVDNEGKYQGIDECITSMIGSKPHLFGVAPNKTGTSASFPPAAQPSGVNAMAMSDVEYEKFRANVLSGARR